MLILGADFLVKGSSNLAKKFIHLPVALISTIVILGLGMGILGSPENIINNTDGWILVILYFLYFLYPIVIEIKDIAKSVKENKKKHIKIKKFYLPHFLLY